MPDGLPTPPRSVWMASLACRFAKRTSNGSWMARNGMEAGLRFSLSRKKSSCQPRGWHAFCYPNPMRKCLIVNDLRGGPAQVLDNQRLTKALINYPYTLFILFRSIYGNSGEICIYQSQGNILFIFLHCKAFILKHLFCYAGRRLSVFVSRDKIIISQIRTSKAAFNL